MLRYMVRSGGFEVEMGMGIGSAVLMHLGISNDAMILYTRLQLFEWKIGNIAIFPLSNLN
jgi:hypothetical protein